MRLRPQHIPLFATAFLLVAVYTFGCVQYEHFSSLRVLMSLLGDNAFLGIAAIGATFVILSGGIDLSVGSVVALTSTVTAALVQQQGVSPVIAIPVALGIGAGLGAIMGLLIAWFELPPFLVTLAGMFLARGLSFMVLPQSVGIQHPFFAETVTSTLAVPLSGNVTLPFTAICLLVLAPIAMVVASFTRFGRTVYAIGSDTPSASLLGLPIGRTKVLIYTVSGLLSATAGLVYSFYTQAGDPSACVGFELDAIASVVIGGTFLRGGVGSIAGTMMGVLILGLIQTIVTFDGRLNTWWTRIVIGALVLAFVGLQNLIMALTRGSGSGVPA